MIYKHKYIIMLVAAVFSVIVTYLHVAVFSSLSQDIILEELYYIPLLLGAFLFGLRGSFITYAFVSLLYLPFLFNIGEAEPLILADRLLHLFATGLFAMLAGFLIDRSRKLQKQIDKDKYLSNIGQVATTIVHDLKNPLIVILGFAKRMRDRKGNIADAAQTIIESAENMQRIVHDVLDFSKPIKLELKKENLGTIIQKACDYCKTKADERGVSLIANFPDYLIETLIDGFALQRALVNLINNGIEASERGQAVKVSIETARLNHTIRIKDLGTGMDNGTLENIFIPFYSKKHGGTGLGMAIAKKIIEGHRGKINIKSEVGKGTEVFIELSLQ